MKQESVCSMEDQIVTTLCNSIQALGRGFDVTSDIRLLYCKGAPGSRLVHIDEDHARDLLLSDDGCGRGNKDTGRIAWTFCKT
ncbi:hypothetical protein JRO89_XS06G0032500 [Xanthoceras sorbifolium]|uniref:Uncharacterized protein n=1 Tax=Xanthoceras sorbifolium TaxID=99658 RepID=A0ABQ8HWE7_9ROSI|nr:hypothetical protein JRO89_XS06G0032500 [Xanthoceras sorbifolium]